MLNEKETDPPAQKDGIRTLSAEELEQCSGGRFKLPVGPLPSAGGPNPPVGF